MKQENQEIRPQVLQEGDTITRIHTAKGEIILLGTAHVSEDSTREVEERIRNENPDLVCIELDDNRLKSLNQENSWKNLDIYQVIRQKKTFLLLSNLVLSSYQKRLGLNLGTRPGDEMRAAIRVAGELAIPTRMIDRDIQLTLTRAWRKSGFWGRNKILAVLIGSAFSREELDEQAIESLKQRSALDDMMKEMAEFLPSVKTVLIDERDDYLAIKTWQTLAEISQKAGRVAARPAGTEATGTAPAGEESGESRAKPRVLAVVGAGHVPGMIRKIQELEQAETPATGAEAAGAATAGTVEAGTAEAGTGDPSAVSPGTSAAPLKAAGQKAGQERLEEISRLPAPGIVGKVLPWLLVVLIASLLIAGFFTKGWEGGFDGLLRWILVNGSLSAIGAAAALGHPLTVLASFLAAPITSMNPTIGVGFVSGILESLLRKPRVEDFERLGDDIASLKGFFRNRVTRILLVFFFSSLGSAIGTFVALPLILP